jgi:hypothetical protein
MYPRVEDSQLGRVSQRQRDRQGQTYLERNIRDLHALR